MIIFITILFILFQIHLCTASNSPLLVDGDVTGSAPVDVSHRWKSEGRTGLWTLLSQWDPFLLIETGERVQMDEAFGNGEKTSVLLRKNDEKNGKNLITFFPAVSVVTLLFYFNLIFYLET